MITKFKKLIIIALSIKVLLLGLVAHSYYNVFLNPYIQGERIVIIPKGSSINLISKILYKNNVIQSQTLFTIIAKLLTLNGVYIQAGEYSFQPKMRMIEMLNKMIKGDVIMHKLTIPEGLTNSQTFTLLNKSYGLTGNINKQYQEGTLLPETYTYRYGDSKNFILDQMKSQMDHALANLLIHAKIPPPLKNINDILILASIIEKETSLAEERPRVARVYLNRLINNIPLQADPTVIYGITHGEEIFSRKVTFADLDTNSPYNTYKISGLPPTPIANPGIDSIKAVLNPTHSDELYFVADGRGGHWFSSNYSEHIKNVKNYRNINSYK
jgi:UPF0755 protein